MVQRKGVGAKREEALVARTQARRRVSIFRKGGGGGGGGGGAVVKRIITFMHIHKVTDSSRT